MKRHLLTIGIIVAALIAAAIVVWSRCRPYTPALMAMDFSEPDALAAWSSEPDVPEPEATIVSPEDSFLSIERGFWSTKAFTPEPDGLYRIRFRARTDKPLYWVMVYEDADGQFLAPSPYDRVYGGGEWRDYEGCAHVHPDAVRMRLRFEVIRGDPLEVDDVRIEQVPPFQVQRWARQLGRAVPPLDYKPPHDRWMHLNRTRNALRRGKPWRIVMVGDSICADIANSLFDVRLGARWMTSDIELINSARRNTGPYYFTQPAALEKYVLRHEPDLLIITGISHGHNAEGHRALIHAVRKVHDCDILVMPGSIAPRRVPRAELIEATGKAANQLHINKVTGFPARLGQMAEEEQVAFLDIRTAWESHLASSEHPHEWYMRDGVHANSRGKYVVGEILLRFLAP
jgi:hypothetical protein